MASQLDSIPPASDVPQQDNETPADEIPVPVVTCSQTKESAECEGTAEEDSATSSPQQDNETPADETPVPMVTCSQTKESAECEGTAEEDSATSSQTDKESEDGAQKSSETGDQSAVESSAAGEGAVTDPYHYLTREHFTSEIFKIELKNLPRHFGFAQLKKMITNLQLKPKKVKAVNKATYAFVTFSCEEDKEEALKVLDGHKWKGNILKAKLAKPIEDPYAKSVARKRSQDESNGNTKESKRRREEESLPLEERLNNTVTPLWNQPYEDQLKIKQNNTMDFLRNLSKMLQRNVGEMTPWLSQQRKKHQGMACELEPIKPSPVLESYRNKCEFTVGKSVDGTDKTVGFRLGSYRGGQVSVVTPTACSHVCPATKSIVAAFQKYIQEESSLESYGQQMHTGHWRMLLVRTSLIGGRMAAAFMHPQALSKEAIEEEKVKLRHFFREGEGKSCGLTSLYINLQPEERSGINTYNHLDGDEYINEDLLDLKFRISPDAFFQVNTVAAEVLYTTVGDWAQVTPSTTVLDICCGTGTIGITLAKRVMKVIGIEMNQQAVNDAIYNAKTNDLSNIEYTCGKAEDVLPDIMNDLKDCEDIVGIVDPPRPGMPPKVLQAVRRCTNLRRLVYVSCNPQNAINNFIDLCRPVSNRNKGIPFRPIKAVAIDLFPHTKHCELIILFERADKVDSFYTPDSAY